MPININRRIKVKIFTITMFVAFALMVSIANSAPKEQNVQKKVTEAKKGYMKLLKSKNPRMRHEGICQLAQLKSQYPDYNNFQDCKKLLSKIAQKDSYYHLRDAATLTLMYLENTLFNHEVKLAYKGDATEFFEELHELAHMQFYEDVNFSTSKAEKK